MTQDQKELLIKDLCTRLPYGVKVREYGEIYPVDFHNISSIETTIQTYKEHPESIKPILFPLSSIESFIMINGIPNDIVNFIQFLMDNPNRVRETGEFSNDLSDDFCSSGKVFDTFNKYHIDYRGLIEKGLAISVFDLPKNPY